MSRRRADFGSIRRLPSGRWQARHRDPDGHLRAAPHTFTTRADASAYLAQLRTDVRRGEWTDPKAGRITLTEYAAGWLDQRRVRGEPLARRTKILYSGLLAKHILPELGHVDLRHLDTATVRKWHGRLAGSAGPGTSTAAKSYRLLHAICATAVAEEEIRRNPCVMSGAGQEPHSMRPALSVQEIEAIANTVPPRWRGLVLLAAYCGLRFGELAAVRRDHLDLERGAVIVDRSVAELPRGVRHEGPPKSRAGRREVAIPPHIIDDLRGHLAAYGEPGPSARSVPSSPTSSSIAASQETCSNRIDSEAAAMTPRCAPGWTSERRHALPARYGQVKDDPRQRRDRKDLDLRATCGMRVFSGPSTQAGDMLTSAPRSGAEALECGLATCVECGADDGPRVTSITGSLDCVA